MVGCFAPKEPRELYRESAWPAGGVRGWSLKSYRCQGRSYIPAFLAVFGQQGFQHCRSLFPPALRPTTASMKQAAAARKGARHTVLSTKTTIKKQAKRTILRSIAAQRAGSVPGKPGPKISVSGSKGGPNGARDARRTAATQAEKTLRSKPAAAPLMLKPAAAATAAAVHKRPAATLRKKLACGTTGQQLGLLEVCAYPGSALSHIWATRGDSAVRIAHRKSGVAVVPKPGPEPVKGRALTWYCVCGRRARSIGLPREFASCSRCSTSPTAAPQVPRLERAG